jgi:hypothetical protein
MLVCIFIDICKCDITRLVFLSLALIEDDTWHRNTLTKFSFQVSKSD